MKYSDQDSKQDDVLVKKGEGGKIIEFRTDENGDDFALVDFNNGKDPIWIPTNKLLKSVKH